MRQLPIGLRRREGGSRDRLVRMYRVGMHLLDGLYPSCDLDQVHSSWARRFLVSFVVSTTTFVLLKPFVGFL